MNSEFCSRIYLFGQAVLTNEYPGLNIIGKANSVFFHRVVLKYRFRAVTNEKKAFGQLQDILESLAMLNGDPFGGGEGDHLLKKIKGMILRARHYCQS